MKLLIVTQKIDASDDVLGFFHRWVEEFAKHCESVTVICLQKGKFNLPKNVKILSLGKECGVSKFKYLTRFFNYIWTERNNYDAVFVHMNSEYAVLGGWLWKLLGKKIILWFVHKSVPWHLKIAEKFVDKILTVSKNSCRIRSSKIEVVGHGIDIELFQPGSKKQLIADELKIISVGRITHIKDYQTFIEAVRILIQEKKMENFHVRIIGQPVYASDKKYFEELKNLIKSYNLGANITFTGPRSFQEMPAVYREAEILINLCPTGGKDKAVLEAMASGIVPIVANESFREDFGPFANQLIFKHGNGKNLAEKILAIKDNITSDLKNYVREKIIQEHNLNKLIEMILDYFKNEELN